jgi:hypothetical protein
MTPEDHGRLPDDDFRVDFGAPAPGSANPMPDEVCAAYQARIEASVEAQAAGARLAARLFVAHDR